MNMKPIINIFIVGFILSMSVFAQSSNNPADSILPVVKCADFIITGKGNSPEWDKTRWVCFDQRGTASPYQTQFKIMYSDSGIYCLYDCMDHMITATLQGDNLDIFNEDVVEAFFWADENVPVYFEYELSPLNYELVLMVPNYNGNFLGWIPWHYSGNRLTRHAVSFKQEMESEHSVDAWTGEFFIPFELMKPMVQKPPAKGDRWMANFYRIDYDNPPGRWSWMPIKKNFHDYRLFGTILFE